MCREINLWVVMVRLDGLPTYSKRLERQSSRKVPSIGKRGEILSQK